MKGVDELGRYSLIVGYYGFFKNGGAILDVGCGEGILQQQLANFGLPPLSGNRHQCERYRESGAARADERTEFRHTDIESFVPDQKFDTIIFNEVLYYLSDPAGIVRRLADSLAPGGIMIASTWTGALGRRRPCRLASYRFGGRDPRLHHRRQP